MTKDIKIDPNKKDMQQRIPVTSDEKAKFENLTNVMAILNVQLDGVKELLFKHAVSIRKRMDINEEDTPKGYERFVDFDPETFDVLVIDRPILQEDKKEEKQPEEVNEAVN